MRRQPSARPWPLVNEACSISQVITINRVRYSLVTYVSQGRRGTEKKARTLTAPVLGSQRAEAVTRQLRTLEPLASIRDLTQLLSETAR